MTGIVIQARMDSTRLPGKALVDLGGKPLLQHILDRSGKIKTENRLIIVATSHKKSNDVLADFCSSKKVYCFRGSEDNVLERYWQCALQYHLKQIVRLTADNPFVDYEELERLMLFHAKHKGDFSYSDTELPEGMGAEIFTIHALSLIHQRACHPNHFEHIDDYLLEHPEEFRCRKLKLPPDKINPDVRLTVDTPKDLEKARFILSHASSEWFNAREAIQLCSQFV